MHLNEPVVVWCSAIDDDKNEVVVVVELGPLVEVLGVFDRERVKLEHIAEDLKVPLARLIEVEPKKVAAREQPLDRVTIEVDLAAALIVDDVTDRGARPIRCSAGISSQPSVAGRTRTLARRRAVFHTLDATSTLRHRSVLRTTQMHLLTRASDGGYAVMRDVDGVNILFVDDTFTSGARIQSATSALTLARATVVAAIPIGRVINPQFNEATREHW